MKRWLPIAALAAVAWAPPAETRAASGLKVVVILDNSGSMTNTMRGGGTRIDAAKRALLTVLDQTPDDAEVGVVLLNGGPRGQWLLPLGPVDRETTRGAVGGIRASGATPLGASLKLATDELLTARGESRYGTYKLLVVTDGEATDADLVERYLPEVLARGVLVDVIGVSMGSEHSLATRANTYRSADDPASLEQAISAVVLGESTADGGDAGESDFELLEALPTEIAAAALEALTTPTNTAIGDTPAQDGVIEWADPAGQGGRGGAPRRAPDGGGSAMRLIVIGVIIFVVIRVLKASVGKH